MNALLVPNTLKLLCKKYALTPSKKYGQNYLISDAPIRKMIEAGELTRNDTVVEIGPGFGVLTFAIAPLVKKVVAFEIEKKLEKYWEEKQQEFPNVNVVWGNALKELKTRDWRLEVGNTYKVLANLPYQITSHAIRTLLELEYQPERIIIMVQKEVAERMCARSTRFARSGQTRSQQAAMSVLAVSVQYYGTPEIITHVPKGSFWPAPKVDSAVVAITNIQERSIRQAQDKQDAEDFFRFVRAGFASKRKQLWKNLSSALDISGENVKAVLKKIVGNEKVRAEELSVEEWERVVASLKRFS